MINAFWLILVRISPPTLSFTMGAAIRKPVGAPTNIPVTALRNSQTIPLLCFQMPSTCLEMSLRRPVSAASHWSSVVACSPSEMRWSRSAGSTLVPPGFLLRNVTVLDICPLKPSEVVDLQVELHTDPSPLFPGCLHGNQKGKGSSGRKEPQQKDNFSDICKLNDLTARVGTFQRPPVGTDGTSHTYSSRLRAEFLGRRH